MTVRRRGTPVRRLAPEDLYVNLEIRVMYVTEGTEVEEVTGLLRSIESEQVNKGASNSTWRPKVLYVQETSGRTSVVPVQDIVTVYVSDSTAAPDADLHADCDETINRLSRGLEEKDSQWKLALDQHVSAYEKNRRLVVSLQELSAKHAKLRKKHKKLKRKFRRLQGWR